MIEAELQDGRVLEFPDGTDPSVIQDTVKRLLGSSQPRQPGAELQQFRTENLKNLIESLPTVGAVGGGLLGAAAGPAGSLALGSAVGTALGASIGTSAKQVAEQVQGKRSTTKEVLGEQVSNISEQVLWDTVGNTIGSAVVKTLNRALPAPREGADIAQRALREKGGTLTASQAVESPTLNLAESFARAGAGGKGQFIGLDKRNADALQAIKDDLIGAMSKDPVSDRVAGKLFQDTIKRGNAAHASASTALYKTFDQRVGSVLVDASDIKLFGMDLQDQFARIGNVGKTEAGGRLIDQLVNIPTRNISFSDAHILRSNLLATIRDFKASGQEGVALRNATLALKRVEDSMETAAKNLSPDLFTEYRNISRFYRTGKEAFNNDVIQTLMREQPERIGENLFKTGNVSEIIQAKASIRQAARHDPSINPERVLNRLQAGYLNSYLTSRAAVNIEGETTAQNLAKHLADVRTNRQLKVMFNSAEQDAIADFGRTAFLTLKNKPSQFGILAPLLQAGAIGSVVVTGDVGPAEIGLLFSPLVLGKVLTNPALVTALTRGLKVPAGTAVSGGLVAKIVNEWNKTIGPTSEIKGTNQ